MRFSIQTSILAPLVLIGTLASANAIEITQPKAVVELFTSQGCHSCPPADKVIGEFADTNEILGIGIHVDYWDYLGWKDQFASKGNTQRQYAYAKTLMERQVYTPQAIVNGQAHEVGSRKSRIKNLISDHQQNGKGLTVPIDVSANGDTIAISIGDDARAGDATLYLFSMKRSETVEIANGENGGKTLKYHHILRNIQPLGMVKANGLSLNFPLSELKKDDNDCYALILQKNDKDGNPSLIVGATYLSDI